LELMVWDCYGHMDLSICFFRSCCNRTVVGAASKQICSWRPVRITINFSCPFAHFETHSFYITYIYITYIIYYIYITYIIYILHHILHHIFIILCHVFYFFGMDFALNAANPIHGPMTLAPRVLTYPNMSQCIVPQKNSI
jgi:hypothetical protein